METNREALRRLAREARIEIAKQPAWMRTPPREPISRRQSGELSVAGPNIDIPSRSEESSAKTHEEHG